MTTVLKQIAELGIDLANRRRLCGWDDESNPFRPAHVLLLRAVANTEPVNDEDVGIALAVADQLTEEAAEHIRDGSEGTETTDILRDVSIAIGHVADYHQRRGNGQSMA